MSIGKRIKKARLEMGLSQGQLCGEVITRNMLSLIENDKSRPSMETLQHFAAALSKPMSYFLEEDAVYSPNQAAMIAAEAAYADKDYKAVLVSLDNYTAPDPVFDNARYLLEVLACERLAEQAIADGKQIYALNLLTQADKAAQKTPYAPDPEHRTLLRYAADPKTAENTTVSTAKALLLRAENAILRRNYPLAATILEAAEVRPPRWYLLRGTAAFHMKEGALAVRYLSAAEEHFPREVPLLLEQAYILENDYTKAYEIANKYKR